MGYGEILDKSSKWEHVFPMIAENELFAIEDLSENDIVIRQINCSKILVKLLDQRLKSKQPLGDFNFYSDFYGKKNYWMSDGCFINFLNIVYYMLSVSYFLLLKIMSVMEPLTKLNTVI